MSQTSSNLARKRNELAAMREKYTAKHPIVSSLASEVAAMEREMRMRTEQIIESREHQRRALQSEQATVQRQVDEISQKLRELPGVLREIEVLNAQINALSKQYAQLAEQAVTSDISRTSFADYSVQILSPALHAFQVGRGDIVRILLAPILALMVGIGLAFYLENLDHSIANREDVERHVNIPVLASFPDTHVGKSKERTSGFSGASVPFRRRGSGRM